MKDINEKKYLVEVLKTEYFDSTIIEPLLGFLKDGSKNFAQIEALLKIDRTLLRNILDELDGTLIKEFDGHGRERLFEIISENEIDQEKLKTVQLNTRAILFEIHSYYGRKLQLEVLVVDFKQFKKMTDNQKHLFNYKVATLYLICLFEKLDHSMFEARGKDFALMHSDLKHWQKQKAKFFFTINSFINSMVEEHRNEILNDIQIVKQSKSAIEIEAMFKEACELNY